MGRTRGDSHVRSKQRGYSYYVRSFIYYRYAAIRFLFFRSKRRLVIDMSLYDRAQKSIRYLAETDEDAARARSLKDGLEDQKKTILATEFLKHQGSQGERAKLAEASEIYKKHLQKLEFAIYDYELYRNKRMTESLVIEMWRSENANRRTGNIT